MPKPKPPYLLREKTRHGKMVWYVRAPDDKGRGKRIRLTAPFDSKEFMVQYKDALEGRAPGPSKTARGSLKWLIETYMASREWNKLAPESRKQMSYQFSRMVEKGGREKIIHIKKSDVLRSRDDRAHVPSDANKFIRASKLIFEYALARDYIPSNPAQGIPKLATSETGEGFKTWTDDDCAAYEAQWPIGTMQRLAYDIFRYTGLRRHDATLLGPGHIKDGEFTIVTQKTGMEVSSVVPLGLVASLAATKTGPGTFLVNLKGKPFDKFTFGNWFRKACRAAKVFKSAHGIRKATAKMAAEADVTEAQINSFFGWAHGSKESAVYLEKARRNRMATSASKKMFARPLQKGAGKSIKKPRNERTD